MNFRHKILTNHQELLSRFIKIIIFDEDNSNERILLVLINNNKFIFTIIQFKLIPFRTRVDPSVNHTCIIIKRVFHLPR